MKEMTNEEAKNLIKECTDFKDYPSIKEYIEDIVICLIYSPWHYSEEGAREQIKNRMWYIEEAYERKESTDDCCAEVGYNCG